MAATVAVGIYASSRVKDSKDIMVAGRSLPLYMNFACVFATWFGAETVLSVSAKFAHKGLGFVSGDPFGASMCLILVAFFFARTFRTSRHTISLRAAPWIWVAWVRRRA
jgi:Na+/proline symporter